jgi:acetyl esterase/lipase
VPWRFVFTVSTPEQSSQCKGGGVRGNRGGDGDRLNRFADEAPIIVISPEYSLAPRWPHPAQRGDILAVKKAIQSGRLQGLEDGASMYIGGPSAFETLPNGNPHTEPDRGGTFALDVAFESPGDFQKLILVVPVVDLTADESSSSWQQNIDAPLVSPCLAKFYRDMTYGPGDLKKISPLHAPVQKLKDLPDTLVECAELDLFCIEAESFVVRMQQAGQKRVCIHKRKDAVHASFTIGGELRSGPVAMAGQAMEDAIVEFLKSPTHDVLG